MNKITKIAVTLRGITPIMFDRFLSMDGAEIRPEDKMYLAEDKKTIILPSINLSSFLSADLTESATKRVMGKKWKGIARAALSYVTINPFDIPFTNGKELLTLDNSGWYVRHDVARVKKSGGLIVPSPKARPVIPTPWELSFELQVFENKDINEVILQRIFEEGGISVGLGTFRGRFGKFEVARWEIVK